MRTAAFRWFSVISTWAVVTVLSVGCGSLPCGHVPLEDNCVRPTPTADAIPHDDRPPCTDTTSDPLRSKYHDPGSPPQPATGHGVLTTGQRFGASERPSVRPLPILGTWVASGRMGDAERLDGPLSYRLVENDPSTQATYCRWSYEPSMNSTKGWVALAFQYPDSNWGDAPGKDLSRRGFTRLTFRARGRLGGTLIVKSGGHSRPGAPYPASFESDPLIVTLDKSWRIYSVPLDGLDLSNVPAAFTFVLRASSSGPCIFDLADIMFCGADN